MSAMADHRNNNNRQRSRSSSHNDVMEVDNNAENVEAWNNAAHQDHHIDVDRLSVERTCRVELMSGLRMIPVRTCRSVDYLIHPKAPERKGVMGVMLSLSTAIGNKASTLVTAGGARYTSGTGPNSRLRLANTVGPVKYDRIVHFADCSSTNGSVFACILHTKTESERFFECMKVGQQGIGDFVLLEEVFPVNDTLGTTTNVPLVKRCSHVLPICGDVSAVVPEVPLIAPDKGDTKYFCKHHVRTLEFGHVCIQQAICGGKLCDRQDYPTGTGQSCGCFFKTERHDPLVVEATVTFPVSMQFDAVGVQSVIAFRSLRTSKLFVAPDCWELLDRKSQDHEDALRVAVERINRYISKKGGWTYIGWVRTGAVTDQSDPQLKDVENIASLSQTPHISYLFPTDPHDVADTNLTFQRLRLHAGELM